MKKINVEATKLNNEDVIATSGITCKGKYHVLVDTVNGSGNKERCYLYEENESGKLVAKNVSEVSELTGVLSDPEYNTGYVDLGTPNEGDIYYWNGSAWKKCNDHTLFN